MYDFDTPISRAGTHCLKWDTADARFGGHDLLPMWIADMDFETAPQIYARVREMMEGRPVLGYGALSPDYYRTVADWMERRHHYSVDPEWIVTTPGVVAALCIAVQVFTQPGEEIMVLTPVYGPFYRAIEEHGRVAVRCPLKKEGEIYSMDFPRMEQMLTDRTRAIMLCSPQNPTGRVWDRAELEQLAAFCEQHRLKIINDEIHNDLVYGKEHIVFNRVSPYVERNSILCTAPSKTFNLAGVEASNIIIPDRTLREAFRQFLEKNHMGMAHCFVEPIVRAAYGESEDWLDALLAYLKGNIDYFVDTLHQALPQLKVSKPEGTYLVWVDFRALGMTADALSDFLVQTCRLALNDGREYGVEGDGFFRFNLACPRSYVEEAVRRLKAHCGPVLMAK